ncbi:hypothetical protein ABIF65_011512 [Bradyrhizobium japonicum]
MRLVRQDVRPHQSGPKAALSRIGRASLLIEDKEAAEYFTEIFEFDWKNVATDRVAPDHGPSRPVRTRHSDEEAPVPLGFRTVAWGAWEGT